MLGIAARLLVLDVKLAELAGDGHGTEWLRSARMLLIKMLACLIALVLTPE